MVSINNKLVSLIRSFSKDEIKEFKKFIASPFFTGGRNYTPFLNDVLNLISVQKNRFDKKSFKKSQDNNFSEQTFRNRYSELYKLAEEFLIHNSIESDMAEKDKLLLNNLLEKKQYSQFRIKYRTSLNQLTNDKFDKDTYYVISEIKKIHVHYFTEKNKAEDLLSEYYENSQIILCISLISLFELGLNFRLMENENINYDPNYVTGILNHMDLNEMMKEFNDSGTLIFKVTSMLYNLYKAYENKSEKKYYVESFEIFNEISSDLKDSYKTEFINLMTYYCIAKLNDGDQDYRNNLFNLYEEKLNLNLISDLQSKLYVKNSFRDYIYIALSLKKFQWVEKFIQTYSDKLPDEFRKDEIKLSYAKLDFEKHNFKRSLANLVNMNISHYLQYIDASLFKLCNYYELNKYEEAFSEIEKQKQYFRNHAEIPKLQSVSNINFMKILYKLIKIKTRPGNDDAGLIKIQLNELKNISKKEWLLEKIDELNS